MGYTSMHILSNGKQGWFSANMHQLRIIVLFVILYIPVGVICTECSGTLNGVYTSESCAVGGCCIPSDGTGDTLCCIPTLTIILVSVFIGGTIVVIIVVIVCCLLCRYRKKKKIQRRQEERRRQQRERDQERQRRLMLDPFVNGDPFLNPPPGTVEGSAQPPHYHGRVQDGSLTGPQPTSLHRSHIPPPYPKSPPPAYFSRIGNHQEQRQNVLQTQGTTTPRPRSTSTRIASRTTFSPNDIHAVIPTSSHQNLAPSRAESIRNDSRLSASRMSSEASTVYDRSATQSVREQSVLTIQDLEEEEKPDSRYSVGSDSRVSRLGTPLNIPGSLTSYVIHENSLYRVDSRASDFGDSRASTRLESRLFDSRNSSRASITHNYNNIPQNSTVSNAESINRKAANRSKSRGQFIKSSISDISEEEQTETRSSTVRNYVTSVNRSHEINSKLDYV